MPYQTLRYPILLILLAWLPYSTPALALDAALDLREIYSKTVDRKLALPADEQRYYAKLLLYTLRLSGLDKLPAQYILMADRSPLVQAVFLFWLAPEGHLEYIGASPASTGKEAGYEYFETPLGIFENRIEDIDFRAEGTINQQGIMGYGRKGMRIYDFGWITARKTWIAEMGEMRLQLHSTDPRLLEPKLGISLSKGCIRIPATLNKLLDHYGILDANYERSSNKRILAVLDPARDATPWSGKYLVVVDSRRARRTDWSPLPATANHPASARGADTGH